MEEELFAAEDELQDALEDGACPPASAHGFAQRGAAEPRPTTLQPTDASIDASMRRCVDAGCGHQS